MRCIKDVMQLRVCVMSETFIQTALKPLALTQISQEDQLSIMFAAFMAVTEQRRQAYEAGKTNQRIDNARARSK